MHNDIMPEKISAVINTLNEERNIRRAIDSIKWVDEIIVCDMHSDDQTIKIAKGLGAKIILHKRSRYVEPARNFAISKASGEWILILDADEQVPESLKERLLELANRMDQIDYVRIPRKNLIFGKWMQESQWWPDLNVRFFKKDKVSWGDKIHRPPKVSGLGLDLPAEEKLAIIHHNYQTISQFLERMNRYTDVQAEELKKEGYKFRWIDLFEKPLNEFLSRFFANNGYKDGLHGLAVSFLQSFSFLVLYLKLWEKTGFRQQDITLDQFDSERIKGAQSIEYWMKHSRSSSSFKKFLQRFKR